MPIVFRNKGVIDTRFITSFGVSAKEGTNPVGFFGTGLKYAIAVLVREQQDITIRAGTETMTFVTRTETLRNKEFKFIDMLFDDNDGVGVGRKEMPFTTEFGKTWEMWQAFRELYCNCMDEGGEVLFVPDYAIEEYAAGITNEETVVIVSGDKIKEAWDNRESIILTDKLFVYNGDSAEILREADGDLVYKMFYQNIRVKDLEKPSVFRYNLKSKVALTEDRTLKYDSHAASYICMAICKMDDEKALEAILLAPEGTYERDLSFNIHHGPSDLFLDVVGRLRLKRFGLINKSALKLYEDIHKDRAMETEAIQLDALEEKILAKAKYILKKQLYCTDLDDYPLYVLEMEQNTLGLYKNGKIFLNRQVFRMGTKYVASTLYEEYLHAQKGVMDCTREMQNLLFDTILTLAERLEGEPI